MIAADSRQRPTVVKTGPSSAPAPAAAGGEPATLADQAYEQVKRRIFDFALMPGERVPETDLAQQLRVSRTPLRAALQRLAREGFLKLLPRQGWQVAPLDFDVMDELYDLRVLIECDAVRQLAQAEQRPELPALADTWLVAAGERVADGEAVGALDEQFHAALVRGSGNREMARVHQEVTERIRIIRRLDFTNRSRVETTYDEHARIVRAITRRRADEAQRLLRAHIEQSKLEVRHVTLDMLYRARRRA